MKTKLIVAVLITASTAAHQGVLFEPLCPIDQVAIIRTRLSSNLHIVLVKRVRMLSDGEGFLVSLFVCDGRSKAEMSVHLDGIPVP